MICRYCKREVEADSIFCRFCGEKLTREKKKKDEIKVPKPRQLTSGRWNIWMQGDGISITEDTAEECIIKAKALRKGILEEKKKPVRITLGSLIDRYIEKNKDVLSPSTLEGYNNIRRNRFKAYMDQEISGIDFQKMINEESRSKSPKTVTNAWGLVRAAFNDREIPVPKTKTPKIPESDLDFLDYGQIKVFLNGIKGDSAECAALLALHSLRSSELHALDVGRIRNNVISIRGAEVRGPEGYVSKKTNKTDKSARDIPVMIPRLLEILPKEGKAVTLSRGRINEHIKKVCVDNSLPECTIHDLRRSFATLAYHLHWLPKTTQQVGGWKDPTVVNAVYEKLSVLDKNQDISKMKRFYGMEKPKRVKLCTKLGTDKKNG